jgi:hypothetical protein
VVPDAQKGSVATIKRGVLDDSARLAYAQALQGRCDTSGGLQTVDSTLAGTELFDVVVDGAIVARYALQAVTRPKGVEVEIVAAAGRANADLTVSILPIIEKQAAGADRLTVYTRRRGLVKKLLGQGWTLDSFVLRKAL